MDIAERSSWNRASLKQFFAACLRAELKPTSDIVDKIKRHARVLPQSVVVEEAIGDLSRCSKNYQTTMLRALETFDACSSMSNFLEPHTQHSEQRYDVPLATKRSKLPRYAFEVKAEQRSMPFDKIVSYNSKTTWYSPGAPRLGVRDADTRLLRELHTADAFNRAGEAWLGSMCVAAHLLCFRDASDPLGVLYLSLAHFDDHAVVCWPDTPKVDGLRRGLQFFDPDLDVSELADKAVIYVGRVEALRLEWKSLAWQGRRAAGLACASPVLRMFGLGKVTLKGILARGSFWDLTIDSLQKHREWIHNDFSAASVNVAQQLFELVKRVLTCSGMEDVGIFQLPLVANDASTVYATELFDRDEASEVLEAPDAQVVQDDQAALLACSISSRCFSWTTRARSRTSRPRMRLRRVRASAHMVKDGAEKVAVEASIGHGNASTYMPTVGAVLAGQEDADVVRARPAASEKIGTVE